MADELWPVKDYRLSRRDWVVVVLSIVGWMAVAMGFAAVLVFVV